MERSALLPHPPEKVWRALTEKVKVARWLYPVTDNIDPVVGHHFAFLPGDSNSANRIDCTVVTASPGQYLAYTWQPSNGEPQSLVTWMLEPFEGGTRVRLRHDGCGETTLPTTTLPRLNAALNHNGVFSQRRLRSRANRHSIRRGELLCL